MPDQENPSQGNLDLGLFATNPSYNVELKTRETHEEMRVRLELLKMETEARLAKEKTELQHKYESEKADTRNKQTAEAEQNIHVYRMEAIGVVIISILLLFAGYLIVHFTGSDETAKANRELAEKIIVAALSAVGGYGVGSNKKKKDE